MEEMKEQAQGAPVEEAPAEGGGQLEQMVKGVVDSMATLLSVLDEGGEQVNPQAKASIEQAMQLFQEGVSAIGGQAPQQQPSNQAVPVNQPEGRPMGPTGV